jgi:hypothetical protein
MIFSVQPSMKIVNLFKSKEGSYGEAILLYSFQLQNKNLAQAFP